MSRPRLSFDADTENRIILIRYLGNLDGAVIVAELIEHWKNVEQLWEYDNVFDLRRFEGVLSMTEVEALAIGWNDIVRGRDAGRMTAIIAPDPLIFARLRMVRGFYPLRAIDVFDTVDEGLDWIQAQRGAGAALSA